jgi:quercetin dioxygenase-like cupin family protein
MDASSLNTLTDELLAQARAATSGRAAHTVHGGHDHTLRLTVIALAAGHGLADHESPGEATLQVLRGRVRLTAAAGEGVVGPGDLIVVPDMRHALDALEDSAVLLTVVKELHA